MRQLHKKFTTEQVKDLLQRYVEKKIERKYIQEILGLKKAMFFRVLQRYRDNPDNFSIDYTRKSPKRISEKTEQIILKELRIDQEIIEDKNNPTQWYNYSYIRDRLENKYKQKVSLPTIIDRAKKNNFYVKKKSKKKFTIARS